MRGQPRAPQALSVLCFAKPPSVGRVSSRLPFEKGLTENFYLPSAWKFLDILFIVTEVFQQEIAVSPVFFDLNP